jgi:PleD family two-component response regulator
MEALRLALLKVRQIQFFKTSFLNHPMSSANSNSNDIQLANSFAPVVVCAKPRALVVDDEKTNRAVLSYLLQKQGYETLESASGEDALIMIEASDIDLVLLDIQMDNMDGFAVLEEIRKNYSANEMPVIMVTANSESEHVVRAFESGANDYIHKPIDPAVTMARIDMQIQFMESRKALKKSEERYSLVAQGTNDGLWDWDIATDEVFYSTRWLTMLEVGEKENTRTPDVWLSRIHAEDRDRVIAELENHKAGLTPHFETEMRMRHQNGSFRWTLCRGLAVRNKQNQAVRMAGSLTDITEGKVADALTGLPNRVLFGERLNRCFERRRTRYHRAR